MILCLDCWHGVLPLRLFLGDSLLLWCLSRCRVSRLENLGSNSQVIGDFIVPLVHFAQFRYKLITLIRLTHFKLTRLRLSKHRRYASLPCHFHHPVRCKPVCLTSEPRLPGREVVSNSSPWPGPVRPGFTIGRGGGRDLKSQDRAGM